MNFSPFKINEDPRIYLFRTLFQPLHSRNKAVLTRSQINTISRSPSIQAS